MAVYNSILVYQTPAEICKCWVDIVEDENKTWLDDKPCQACWDIEKKKIEEWDLSILKV